MARPRRITDVDRMLAHADRLTDRATKSARRRTTRRFGQLEIVLVEEAGKPSTVYLTNAGDRSVIVEATPHELTEAVAAVQALLTEPPPIRRRS